MWGMVYHALNRANFRSALFKNDGHYQGDGDRHLVSRFSAGPHVPSLRARPRGHSNLLRNRGGKWCQERVKKWISRSGEWKWQSYKASETLVLGSRRRTLLVTAFIIIDFFVLFTPISSFSSLGSLPSPFSS